MAYNSTYFIYARGMSVLVYCGSGFSCVHAEIDRYGKYVFLYCRLFDRCFVIANVYPTPHVHVSQLFKIFLAHVLPFPVLLMSDFNNIFIITRDRFPPPRQIHVECLTPLGKLQYVGNWVCTICGISCIRLKHNIPAIRRPIILYPTSI